jgi:chemotaxis protein MotB
VLNIPENPPPAQEWLLSYGDLMSLLLTFMVMIVAMSEFPRGEKFTSVANVFEGKFGGPVFTPNVVSTTLSSSVPDAVLPPISSTAKRAPAETQLISVSHFAAQSYALSRAEEQTLRAAFPDQRGEHTLYEVRGWADTAPLARGDFRDPFDLAYERARAVARFLTDELQIPRERIRLSSWTAADAASGRVEIFAGESLPATASAGGTRSTLIR